MLEAVSVDALYGFGAKNFNCCTQFTQFGRLRKLNEPLFFGHSDASAADSGSVMVRFDGGCHILGPIVTPLILRASERRVSS